MPLIFQRRSSPQYAPIGVVSGSLVDGATYNFTSNDSISAPPTVEFLGGPSGVVDSGTVGSSFVGRANWNRLSGSNTCNWKWSTSRLRNRTRSFIYDGFAQGETGNARGTYQYDTGSSGYVELYYSATIYWQANTTPPFNAIQWKMFRHLTQTDHDGTVDNGFGAPEVVDGHPPSAYWSNSTARDNLPFSQFTSTAPGWTEGDASNQTAYNTSDFGGTLAAPQNGWYRMEHYFRENSNTSTSDGVGTIKFTATDGTVYLAFTTSNRLYRSTNDFSRASRPFRYFILQNYFGNTATNNGNDFGDSVLFLDEQYIAWAASGGVSPLRRVEISDGASEPMIQKITSASGTARSITLNKGHLSTFTGCTLREYSDATTVVTTVNL